MATQINFNNLRPFPTDGTLQDSDLIAIQQYGSSEPFAMTWGRFKTIVGSGGSGGGQGQIPINYITQSGAVTIPDFTEEQKLIPGFVKYDIIYGDTVTDVISYPAKFYNGNGNTFDPNKLNIIREQYFAIGSSYTIEKRPIPDVTIPALTSIATNLSGDQITFTFSKSLASVIPAINDFALSGGKSFIGTMSIVDNTVKGTINSPYVIGANITASYTQGTNPIQDTSGNLALSFVNQVVINNVTNIVIQDTFNSSNISNLAGRTLTIGGGTWVKEDGDGTIGIIANSAKLTSPAYGSYQTSATKSDVDIRVSYSALPVNAATDIRVRYQNSNNVLAISPYDCRVDQVIGGNLLNIFAGSGTSSPTDTIRVVVIGTNVKVYRNAGEVTPPGGVTISGALTSQNVGFLIYADAVVALDDFTVI